VASPTHPRLLAGLACYSARVTKALTIVSGLAFWRSGTDGETTVKARNMRRDARVSLCVDDQEPPFSFVLVEGTAEMTAEDPDHLYWATRIAGRYMGAELAEAYGRRNAVPGELLVRVTPNRIVVRKNIAY
jgi:PPOX class probable F420-dependent enzyme